MQRTLSLAAGLGALPLGIEIYLEHFKGSFGDRWMWTPIALTPALTAAGIGGFLSEQAARGVLPAVSAVYFLDGVVGVVTHVRGVHQKPGGLSKPTYSVLLGPPLFAPGSLCLVGLFGLAAPVVARER